jgi:hypothetical protein
MFNPKQKLQSLGNQIKVAIIKLQVKSIHNRQREERFKLTLASIMRIDAQEQFDERTELHAARLKKLQAQLDGLVGEPPLWMGVDLSSPSPVPAAFVVDVSSITSDATHQAAATESELRLAAGQATAGQTEHGDTQLDWPLPCDITIGACTLRRGVPLRALVAKTRVLHAMAAQTFPDAANMTLDPRSAAAS